jgi:hypothetical protein
VILCIVTPEKTNYIYVHYRLVPPGGTGTRVTRRMDEKDHGYITEPMENVTVELPYIPDEFVGRFIPP